MFFSPDRSPERPLFGHSPGDRLLDHAQSIRLDLSRYIDDDGCPQVGCNFRLVGELDLGTNVPTAELLLGLVQSLGTSRPEGGAQ